VVTKEPSVRLVEEKCWRMSRVAEEAIVEPRGLEGESVSWRE
jgi:hypothetical protein